MAYSRAWDETKPPGTDLANTLDTIIQNFKTDIRERVAGIFGLNLAQFAADPIVPISLTLSGALVAGSLSGPLTGNVTGTVSGNAGSATVLQTARAINGVNFDGSAPITVTAAAGTLTGTVLNAAVVTSSLTSVGTLATLTVTGNLTAGTIFAGAAIATGVAAGEIALASNKAIRWTNAAGTASFWGIGFDSADRLQIDASAKGSTFGAAVAITGVLSFPSQAGGFLSNTFATTNAKYIRLTNTGGDGLVGLESSVAGAGIFAGTAAYSLSIGTTAVTSLHLATNNTVRFTIDSAGTIIIPTAVGKFLIGATSFTFKDSGDILNLLILDPNLGGVGGGTFPAVKSVTYMVGAVQVVGSRLTGWATATGTATRTTFDTATVTLPLLAQRIKALIDDLFTHGLIGT